MQFFVMSDAAPARSPATITGSASASISASKLTSSKASAFSVADAELRVSGFVLDEVSWSHSDRMVSTAAMSIEVARIMQL